ncbi:MAG: RDD family protein [Rubricoccaceae bacterium]
MEDLIRIRTAQNVDLGFAPAGLGARVAAAGVDAAVLGSLLLLVLALTDAAGGASGQAVGLGGLLAALLYAPAFEALAGGQSPGKMALRIRVAREDGSAPSLGQVLLRWLLGLVEVGLSLGALAVVAVALSPRSQRLGDLAAGTVVLRRERRIALAEVRYPPIPPGHLPDFPEAEVLSDAEVRTLRAVIARLNRLPRGAARTALAARARAAVERRLGVTATRGPVEAFLLAVVRDYAALADRYTLASRSEASASAPEGAPADAVTTAAARSRSAAAGP